MGRRLLTICLIIFLTGVLATGYSQNGMYIEDLAEKTDLPEGTVNCLAQDDYGFIWIGTYRGLYRYDGYQVLNFSSINPDFKAFKIKELYINQNQLWVGSLATGLFKIDLKTYKTTHYHKNAEGVFKISDDNVLAVTSLSNNTILVGTEWGGLNIISPEGEVQEIITNTEEKQSLPALLVSDITPIDDNTVVLANNGISILNLNNKTIRQILPNVLNKHVYEIANTAEDEFLVFTPDGLYLVNTKNNREEYRVITNERIKTALRLRSYSDPVFLLGTTAGFTEFNLRKQKWETINTEPFNLSPLNITSYLKTRDDVILVGSENGLFSISTRKKHFRHYAISSHSKTPDIISSIVKTDNNLFAGSWGNGILKLNQEKEVLENITIPSFPELPNSFIYSMLKSGNTIWFSTKDNLGIYSFDDNGGPYRLKKYASFPDENGINRTYTVTYIFERKDKTLLLGTWEGLLFYYDQARDTFLPLKDKAGNLPLLRDFSIFSIAEDQNGDIWAGGNGCGLVKLRIEGDKIVKQQLFTEKDGLVSNFVTTVDPSRNNKIWVGTDAGLTIIENEKFTKAFNKDIIYNIQSIIEDPIGFLWIGTQKGLLRINSNNMYETIKLFETTDGLRNRSFYLNSICIDPDFTFYFGGFNGIDYFIPYKIDYNFNKPTPLITNFYLFNEPSFPCNPDHEKWQKTIITASNSIKLRHTQNTFSLEFSNLEYYIPEKCQFAYKLEGVDIEWNVRDAKNRIAYYTKLAPGNYRFLLRSTNNDGVWNDEPTVLDIEITPPFWASTLAYIIYFVAAMVLIFLIMFLRIMKVQETHKQQLKEVEYQKQQELDELKLKFFTNISHEFRTPLTLILGPLAKILETEQSPDIREKHLMIYRNASRLLQLTNRIMDFRKNEKEQLKLNVEETDITEYIKNIFLFFNYEAQKRDIAYQFSSTYNKKVLLDREFIESIVFNMLSNAFKYTPDGKSIAVKICNDDKWVKVVFTDTGRGIATEQLDHIFDRFNSTSKRNSTGIGLSFSKRLIELHKGDIEVKSTFGEGSEFTIKIPLRDIYSHNEKVAVKENEHTVNWAKIDATLQQDVAEDLKKLKSQYEKEELIALVVDDNFEVRQFISDLLQNDFKVIQASNGKEALEIAFETIPDIVISDIMMDEIDGLELCSTLKKDERTDHIPVVLTTVLSAQADRVKGLSVGADSYIPKPIDPAHLLIRVKKLIEKQLKLKDKFNLSSYDPSEDKEEAKPEEKVHPLVEKARNIVLKNLDNSEYNIDDFCSDLGLSRMQLYRKFKAITGLSANSFIRKVRLHKAAELLKTGELTVKEVTYDVGFIDLKYFRKCFFEEFGVNPSEYGQVREDNKEE